MIGALLVSYLVASTIVALSAMYLGQLGLAQADGLSFGIMLSIVTLPILGVWLIATKYFLRACLVISSLCGLALVPMSVA